MTTTRRRLPAVVGALLSALPAAGFAEDGYDAQIRQPVHDGSGLFTAHGSSTLENGSTHVVFSFDHAKSPLLLQAGGIPVGSIIDRATNVELGAYVGLPFRFETGVAVPMSVRSVPNAVAADFGDQVSTSGMGDVRAEVKWNAYAPKGWIPGLAVIAGAGFPTGKGESYLGSGATAPYGLLAVEERVGPASLIANVGYRNRAPVEVLGIEVGSAVLYRAGASYDTGWRGLTVIGELFGAAGAGASPREAGIGARMPLLGDRLSVAAGFDRGVSGGFGTPAWRAFGSVAWRFGPLLRRSNAPRPPIIAGAPPDGGTAGPGGATPPGDGAAAATAAGAPAGGMAPGGGGASTVAGATGGGAPAGGVSGPAAQLAQLRMLARTGLAAYGKSDIPGALEKFRKALESESMLLKSERVLLHKYVAFCHVLLGNPGDAIASFKRALEIEPELTLDAAKVPPQIVDVFVSAQGRPTSSARITITKRKLEIQETIQFMKSTAQIHIDSHPLLDEMAQVLKEHPEIKQVRVEGYTDDTGNPKADLALSEARAKAVMDYLIRKKVDRARLSSEGLGSSKPVADNATVEGRIKNRRVEFVIVEQE